MKKKHSTSCEVHGGLRGDPFLIKETTGKVEDKDGDGYGSRARRHRLGWLTTHRGTLNDLPENEEATSLIYSDFDGLPTTTHTLLILFDYFLQYPSISRPYSFGTLRSIKKKIIINKTPMTNRALNHRRVFAMYVE